MPNVKGGKGYKKGKHGGETEAKMIDWEPSEGQMLGRVMKSLGNRRFKVYCNDNKERLCKLCGSTRKSEWVGEGAIVLIGVREIGTSTTMSGGEVADILNLVDSRLFGKLKKVEGVNILLFSHLEKEDSEELRRKAKLQEAGEAVDDDLFDRDGEEEEDEEEEEDSDEEGLNEDEKKKLKSRKREAKVKGRDQNIAKKRAEKQEGGGRERSDSLDIDKI